MGTRTPLLASATRSSRLRNAALALAALASPGALAQITVPTKPSVRLQPSTPGVQQSGHANIDGTLRAGALRTDSFRLGDSAPSGYVLTTDASGIGTWQAPGLGGGFTLPFAGSAASAGPVFAIENTGLGSAVRGEGSGQSGDLGGPLGGVYGLGDTGVLGSGTFFGVRGESSGGGVSVSGIHSTGILGQLGDPLRGAYGVHSTGNLGWLGDALCGAYGAHTSGNRGWLGDGLFGAYGESPNAAAGAGVRGASLTVAGVAYGVHGSSASVSPAAAGVHAEGNGATVAGMPNAAALLVNNGAIVVAGPLMTRPAGTIPVMPPYMTTPWVPISSCVASGHVHVIGYMTDVVLMNDLILPGPPNVGSMISATVETDPGPPPGQTSYYVQVWGKVAGSCMFRVTRMGTPGGPCPPPAELNYVHYTIINP